LHLKYPYFKIDNSIDISRKYYDFRFKRWAGVDLSSPLTGDAQASQH
jgi:hypothetical protein